MIRTVLAAVVLTWAAGIAIAEAEPVAAAPTSEAPACAPANRIHSWSEIDDRHIYLSMLDKRRRFLVTFLGPCREAKWATIVTLARGSIGKCLWAGDQLIFRRMPTDAGEACWIEKIEPAPAAAAAEPPARQPQPERPATF